MNIPAAERSERTGSTVLLAFKTFHQKSTTEKRQNFQCSSLFVPHSICAALQQRERLLLIINKLVNLTRLRYISATLIAEVSWK